MLMHKYVFKNMGEIVNEIHIKFSEDFDVNSLPNDFGGYELEYAGVVEIA